MSLLDPRLVYAPFEYPQAYEYWLKQQQAHWLHTEISLQEDLNTWKMILTEKEKNVIGGVLKGFTQAELVIGDYWATKISQWMQIPEINLMSHTFSSFETIHAVSYAYLNQSLGLDNFEAFVHEPSTKAKIDRLVNTNGSSKEEIAKSIAIFSAFNEGVSIYSNFAVLMNFSRFNKMKGVGQIIAFSIRDESLHSTAGCWLFRELTKQFPEILIDDFKKEIYEAARLTVHLEDAFIDKIFELGDVEGLTKEDLKNYIRFRTNTKLQDLGLKTNWKNINKEALDRMMWFDILSTGTQSQDFFAGRVVDYSKGNLNWDNIFEEMA